MEETICLIKELPIDIQNIIIDCLDSYYQYIIYHNYIKFDKRLLWIRKCSPLKNALLINNTEIIAYICRNFQFDFDTFYNSIEEIIKFKNNDNIEKSLELLYKNCHSSSRSIRGLDDGYYLQDLYYNIKKKIKPSDKIYNLLQKLI